MKRGNPVYHNFGYAYKIIPIVLSIITPANNKMSIWMLPLLLFVEQGHQHPWFTKMDIVVCMDILTGENLSQS